METMFMRNFVGTNPGGELLYGTDGDARRKF